MTPDQELHVADILRFFFPEQPLPARMSDELADLAARMLHEALQASKAMDLVPRPAGFRPGPLWVISQAVQIAWRSQAKPRIYETVRKTVAVKYRSEYAIAKQTA